MEDRGMVVHDLRGHLQSLHMATKVSIELLEQGDLGKLKAILWQMDERHNQDESLVQRFNKSSD